MLIICKHTDVVSVDMQPCMDALIGQVKQTYITI